MHNDSLILKITYTQNNNSYLQTKGLLIRMISSISIHQKTHKQ